MRLVTQNFTWLTCKDCGERIALYPGHEYDSIQCKCYEPETVQEVKEEAKRGRSRKVTETVQEGE